MTYYDFESKLDKVILENIIESEYQLYSKFCRKCNSNQKFYYKYKMNSRFGKFSNKHCET